MLPLLRHLRDGKEHQLKDVRENIATQFALTTADRNELLPSGKQAVYDNRLGWAKTYLGKAGLIRTLRRGVYQITDRGREVLSQNPAAIDKPYLLRFPEFQEFARRDSGDEDEGKQGRVDEFGDAATPSELLERAYGQLRKETESELLESVSQASPKFFELLVVELLVKMGYGGSREEAGKALGKSHDGGVDGMIKEDHLGLDAIYIQAKRWQNTVGRPEIQAFAGTLEGERARKGVFITTSSFSREAKDYVSRIERKIVLIDGAHLASLMFEFGIGVNSISSYEVKRVDTDYFSEE